MMCPRCGAMTLNNHGDRECLSCGTVITVIRAWDAVSEIPAEASEGHFRRHRPAISGPRVLPEERAAWAAMDAGIGPALTQQEWDAAIKLGSSMSGGYKRRQPCPTCGQRGRITGRPTSPCLICQGAEQ